MTASDHLKHRTGSLGRDQIPEDLKTPCPNCAGTGKVPRPSFVDATQVVVRCRCSACHSKGWIWALDQQEMAERIAKAEAALAQKTRECEEVAAERDRQYEFNAGQIVKVAELEAQVEQLGRQVAAEKEKHEYFVSLYEPQHRQALEERDELRRQVAEMRKQLQETPAGRSWFESRYGNG